MKVLKWIGLVVGGLVGLIVVAAIVMYGLGVTRLSRTHAVNAHTVVVPAETGERGEYLVNAVMGCEGCHGEGLRGQVLVEGMPFGYLPAPNLTAGQGGVGGSYTDADWERALRHGVNREGKPLVVMPAHHYTHLSNEDLAALIATVKSMPPVDNDMGRRQLAVPAYILLAAGMIGELPAEQIDHEAQHTATVAPEQSAEYGAYLVTLATCADCHGPDLSGMEGPAGAAPSITRSGNPGQWTEAQFIQALRTGQTPDGRTLSEEMPWRLFGNMTDEDLGAIYAYLQSLP